jgi:hypothetical protein
MLETVGWYKNHDDSGVRALAKDVAFLLDTMKRMAELVRKAKAESKAKGVNELLASAIFCYEEAFDI